MRITILATLIVTAVAGQMLSATPARKTQTTANLQPLTYANVVSHFKAARLRTSEVQKRCAIFFEGEWKNRDIYNYCVIVVENSDEDVQVTFYLTDAHEMNWVTEFLDAPFFAKDETQRLFQIMHSRREARNEKLGRFRFNFNHWEPKHAQILVFSFTPTG